MLLTSLFLYSATSWAQAPDLRLDSRNQITIPLAGSSVDFCSSTGSNLRFQVVNQASGSANTVNLGTNNLVATLTLVSTPGQSFAPSGTSTTALFSVARTSNSVSGTTFIGAPGFADFDWPTPLEFNSTGTTTIQIEVAIDGRPYPDATANNTVTYQINILSNPNTPVLTTNFGSGPVVNICPGDNVQITTSSVGDEYEFFRNSISMGPRQASNVFITNGLSDNDDVNVTAYFTNGCGSSSNPLIVNVDSVPSAVLSSDAPNNTACTGDNILFTVSGGGWYEFLVNNVSQGASTSVNTFTYGPVLTDNVSVTVRTWLNSTTNCYDEDTINLRLNSVSGVNEIDNPSTICAGEVPLPSYQIKSLLQIEFQKVPQLRTNGKAGLMVGHLPI